MENFWPVYQGCSYCSTPLLSKDMSSGVCEVCVNSSPLERRVRRTIFDFRRSCQHNSGFTLITITLMEYQSIYVCNLCCGFYLNFDPEIFPRGVAYAPCKNIKVIPPLKWEGQKP